MPIVTVTKPYRASYPDPISFEAGEVVHVEREDTEFRGWFWCRNVRCKEGWVHRSALASTGARTTSVRSYNALELTVADGERAALLERLDGWLRIRLDDGREGWLPESHAALD